MAAAGVRRATNRKGKHMDGLEQFRKIMSETENVVFFGGAGVSTESGIPDFRSVDGLYNQKYEYPPETILSHTFYRSHTEEFYRFYRDKMLCLTAKPNAAHSKLAQWEREGRLKAVITQNIDGLHQAAGSKKCWNFMEVYIGIIVSAVINFMMRRIFCIRKAFPGANAAAGSSRMLYYMKKG